MARQAANPTDVTITIHLQREVQRALVVYCGLSGVSQKSVIAAALQRYLAVLGVDDYSMVNDILQGKR
jgi:adenylylsulfate kinase-like enzyme